MTVVELLKEKNKIIREELELDFDLIPESQIMEVEPKYMSTQSDMSSCIYCKHFYDNNCEGCPMDEHGNSCMDDESTYNQAFLTKKLSGKSLSKNPKIKRRLDELFEVFNESNGLEEKGRINHV